MRRLFRRLQSALLLLALVAAGSAAPAGVAGSEGPTPLLDDRLRIHLPEGFRVEARKVDIMAAQVPPANETRVVLDQGDKRLVLMVYELFRTAGPDFAEVLARTEQASGTAPTVRYDRVVDRPSFRVHQSDAPPERVDEEAFLVTAAWVVSADGTVQYLAAYANPAAAAEMPQVQTLFGRALKTLEPGPRKVEVGGRLQRLSLWSDSHEATVRLPEGWAYSLQPGPDFLVHRLQKLVPYGTPSTAISFYVGGHPGYWYRQLGLEAQKGSGRLVGVESDWFSSSDEGRLLRESIRPAPEVDGDTMFHVILSGPTDEELKAAQEIVETMAVVRR